MICADTSSLARYLDGADGPDIDLLIDAVDAARLVIAPMTVTELLSHVFARPLLGPLLQDAVVLELTPGFWERAGLSRRAIRKLGFKAKLADTLIAQACIDADIALITHDPDFRHFETHCGLRLAR